MYVSMVHVDYVVQWSEDEETLAKRILYSIYVRRVKGKKPASTLVIAPSGEGKSWGVVRLEEVILGLQGIDLTPELVEAINIFTPLEYAQKMDKLLFDPSLKHINIVALHEAGDVVDSAEWQSFLTRAVASINNQSRRIKPLIVFIISQHMKQVARSTRVTNQYYVEAQRSIGKKTKFYYYAIWEKKRGLEKSELMPRRLSGFIVDKKGKRRRHYLSYFEMNKPTKENVTEFERMDYEAKGAILAHKLSESLRRIKAQTGDYGKKIDAMVDWYVSDMGRIETIGKRYRGSWKVRPEVIKAHDMNKEEASLFETRLSKRLNSLGYFKKEDGATQ